MEILSKDAFTNILYPTYKHYLRKFVNFLTKTGIDVKGLFFNADGGFDSKEFREGYGTFYITQLALNIYTDFVKPKHPLFIKSKENMKSPPDSPRRGCFFYRTNPLHLERGVGG